MELSFAFSLVFVNAIIPVDQRGVRGRGTAFSGSRRFALRSGFMVLLRFIFCV
jgi:hypothetical protein